MTTGRADGAATRVGRSGPGHRLVTKEEACVDQSLIVNRRTGQRMRFDDPGGGEEQRQTLRIECWSPPSEEREPNHTHPEQASGFEIISGELAFWVDGKEFRAGAGETVTVPAGANHRFWNPTDSEAHYVGTFTPALDSRGFFEVFFRLANEDKLGKGGMPKPLHLPVLFRSFGREIRPSSPPWPVTRLAIAALGPIASLRGYRDPADL
jgi:quercetin dioxygenase-like cupin family protein